MRPGLLLLVLLGGCSSTGGALTGDAAAPADAASHIGDGDDDGDAIGDAAQPFGCGQCPAGQVCSGTACVPLPSRCPCPLGSYCDLATSSCKAGCLGNDHCPSTFRCDTRLYMCIPICNDTTPCADHLACSYATQPDGARLCTQCSAARPDLGAACQCASGFADCNGDLADGCETPLGTLTDCGACGVAATLRCIKDVDRDGYGIAATAHVECACAGDEVAADPSRGEDCADNDYNVNPGQAAYFSTPNKAGTFDYNCDGVTTLEYDYVVDGLCQACTERFWKTSAPGCGVTGMAWNCGHTSSVGGCEGGSDYALLQACH